jgi:Arsenical resistance operon protein ArsD
MKTIQVYDPPMCCSTGICGPDIDPDLVNFAAMLSQLGGHGIKIERYNLGQQPMAFVQNTAVKALLDKEGVEVLPLIFWDGEVRLKGRYPTKEERPEWFRLALEPTEVGS